MKLLTEWMFLAALTTAAMVAVDGVVAMVDRSVDKAMNATNIDKIVEPLPDTDEESK